jgi:hypothetical protein
MEADSEARPGPWVEAGPYRMGTLDLGDRRRDLDLLKID